MLRVNNVILCIMFGLASLQIVAQELPPIQIFEPNEYLGDNQNWSISQGLDKTMYFANNKGLLEYNGAKWQLYPSPNETIMRSVHVSEDRIYTGNYMEFGFWIKNKFGILEYSTLSDDLKVPFIEDEQFWNIIELDDWILFQSLNRIYIYNTKDKTFEIIEPDTAITKMYMVDDTIYFQKTDRGIFKIENGKDVLVTSDPIIIDNIVVNIFRSENGLLIQTQDNGFYQLSNNILNRSNDFIIPTY